MACPSAAASRGSSEKYSKFRPQRGLRFIFSPGPRRRPTPWAAASSPMACPTRRARCTSNEHASVPSQGKQVAGTLAPPLRRACSLSSLRTPCGPSAMNRLFTPFSGMAFVRQKPRPLKSDAFSCSVRARSCAAGVPYFSVRLMQAPPFRGLRPRPVWPWKMNHSHRLSR